MCSIKGDEMTYKTVLDRIVEQEHPNAQVVKDLLAAGRASGNLIEYIVQWRKDNPELATELSTWLEKVWND